LRPEDQRTEGVGRGAVDQPSTLLPRNDPNDQTMLRTNTSIAKHDHS
jgi:hypothetical protein